MVDRLLDKIARVLQTRNEPDSTWRKWVRRLRYLADVATVAYLVPLGLILLILEFGGAGLWLAEPFRFLPAHGWLLPVPATLLLSLVCRRWLALGLNALSIPLVLWLFMGWQFGGEPATNGEALRIVSNNVGENGRNSIQDFLDRIRPQVMAYQDAKGLGARYERRFPEMEVRSVGEFVVISELPIIAFEPVRVSGKQVAAWFDLDWEGERVRLYSVHVPTPRDFLSRFQGLGFAKEMVRPVLRPETETAADFVRERMRLYEGLAEEIAASPHPVVVVGDFNLPPYGRAYRRFAANLQDGHEVAGSGWGMTFPGKSGSIITGYGPWLRIDYAWADATFEFVGFETEGRRKSQHRAVAAAVRKR